VSVGSVGQPRDYDNRASYTVYDSDRKVFEFKRIEYDIETAAEKVLRAKLERNFAHRLYIGAIAAAERGKRGERYVLSGRWLPMLDFMRIAARAAGVSPPLFELPTSVARGFAPLAERAARLMKKEPLFTRASFDALEPSPRDYGDAATRDLGYAPRDLEQTLAETFAWYGERGMMPRGGRLARMLGVTQRT
jgi:hypothetical protein